MENRKNGPPDHSDLRRFYNNIYYRDVVASGTSSIHLRRLAVKLAVRSGQRILDVACGAGDWLLAASRRGAYPVGIDLSHKAIKACKARMPNGEFCTGIAENLPFDDTLFDIVSCLGSLEHFLSPESALDEMVRVAKDDAIFLFLVPNSDFLTRRLGLYQGTIQADLKEQARTLSEWQELFEGAGLSVRQRWRDLHVLSWSWISASRWYHVPLRAAQAVALMMWPLSWQYQVYHLCDKQNAGPTER
jgi:SAM-dependent methyltransferase